MWTLKYYGGCNFPGSLCICGVTWVLGVFWCFMPGALADLDSWIPFWKIKKWRRKGEKGSKYLLWRIQLRTGTNSPTTKRKRNSTPATTKDYIILCICKERIFINLLKLENIWWSIINPLNIEDVHLWENLWHQSS